uniref:MACPF domain-containing protein n=2 Tax=Kalanchoe fedtschenkoi TaxID=63787 RepID=A0A7N0U3X7_KALFE
MEDDRSLEVRAMESLGFGFDLTCDFRLNYAKRSGRLIELNQSNKRDVIFPGGPTFKDVSVDIRCDKGDRIRFQSDVLEFNQMSELLNQKALVQGKIPSGYFNSIFGLSGMWFNDASDTKYIAFDGYFISLYYLHLTASPLVLQESVKKAVPSHWDPVALSRFIQTYGTHIIVGMAIGGQDVICVRQMPSSTIPTTDLRRHLEDLGDSIFSDRSPTLLQRKTVDGKQKVPEVFSRILESNPMQLSTITETSGKDGLSLIWSKRGGNTLCKNHTKWLQSVQAKPDAILFKFVPITSLLTGVAGSGYLSHAINLYLRYKPAPKDLQYFLEFQVPIQWAPLFNELPLRHQRKKAACPSLQFSLFSPKIHISSTEVTTNEKPVTGLRLFLEGKKCNRLAVHVQHLSSLPNVMKHSPTGDTIPLMSQWRGSDDLDPQDQFFEHVKWRKFSSVCTSVVKHDPNWLRGDAKGVFIVTGAQLISKGSWPRTILHLRLLYTYLPNFNIGKKEWAGPPEASRKSNFLTNLSTTFTFTQATTRATTGAEKQQAPAALNSGVFPEGPPVPVRSMKMLKYIETAEVVRGPHDTPGHWLVTAASLTTEGGKIGLHVKFALLDYSQEA